MYSDLFSPIKIRGLELKNRIMLPAMGTKMAGNDKFVTRRIIDYHLARVKGGCGLNFTEVCGVHDPSTPVGFLSLGDDKYIPMLKALTKEVHRNHGKIGVQLWQGGLAVASFQKDHVYLPNDLIIPGTDYNYKAMTQEEIQMIVKSYGEATRRAVEAGFDTVEFHAGHNYLPHAFLSGGMNFRQDEYGGSLENRMRFPLECIQAIRENMPEDMPLFMRVVALDDNLENGLSLDETVEFCKRAQEAGVDIIDVSRGNFMTSAIKYEVPPVDLAPGFNVDNASYIREKAQVKTVAVGRINDPEQADKIIRENRADMVVIGRGQIADPEFANKAREGRTVEIVKCIGCNQGCYDGFVNPDRPFISCLRNPAVGLEKEYEPRPTEKHKHIMIAGGGLAGLDAAITLKKRGHKPTIYEASNKLGGQFLLAGEAPRKEELKAAAISMGEQAQLYDVDIRLNSKVTPELIRQEKPDELIIAIGALALIPGIKGVDRPNVTDSHKVLSHAARTQGHVVIIGGGLVGMEVAEFLHKDHDEISIIEMMDEVGKDLGPLRKITVAESLEEKGINIITQAKCKEILEEGVLIEKEGREEIIPCDTVILSIGAKSRDSEPLVQACKELGIDYYIIGDAKQPRRAIDAIAEARKLALEL